MMKKCDICGVRGALTKHKLIEGMPYMKGKNQVNICPACHLILHFFKKLNRIEQTDAEKQEVSLILDSLERK